MITTRTATIITTTIITTTIITKVFLSPKTLLVRDYSEGMIYTYTREPAHTGIIMPYIQFTADELRQ